MCINRDEDGNAHVTSLLADDVIVTSALLTKMATNKARRACVIVVICNCLSHVKTMDDVTFTTRVYKQNPDVGR